MIQPPVRDSQHRGNMKQQASLCENIKRLGYSPNQQVKLYGEVFQLLADPVFVTENFVFVDALEKKTGHARRVRIPLTVIQMARNSRRAA